jgi:hypothetical protein
MFPLFGQPVTWQVRSKHVIAGIAEGVEDPNPAVGTGTNSVNESDSFATCA